MTALTKNEASIVCGGRDFSKMVCIAAEIIHLGSEGVSSLTDVPGKLWGHLCNCDWKSFGYDIAQLASGTIFLYATITNIYKFYNAIHIRPHHINLL
jgi:hypothetical protein